jgi:glycosyltransferase involved in cell wall biosynthesis
MPETRRPFHRRPQKPLGTQVSVVVPAHNEEENLPALLEAFDDVFRRERIAGELILVDDGSTDRTYPKARDLGNRYRFLRIYSHKTREGVTAALNTGFSVARGRFLFFFPADLQYHPQELPQMIDRLSSGFDVVTGWKQGRYGGKRLVSVIYNLLCRMLFEIPVHDLNSIKGFKREVLPGLAFRKDWHRYLVVMAHEQGFKVTEVKVKLYPRKFGKSKFGLWRIPVGFLDLLAVKFQISFSKKPLLFFGSLGLIMVATGILIGLGAILWLVFRHEAYRPVLYLVMLLEILGISFFGLGFLGEILIEMQNRMDFMAKEVGELKTARPQVVVQHQPTPQPHPKQQGRPHHQPHGGRNRPSPPSDHREETAPLPEEATPTQGPEPKFPFEN